MTAAVKWNDVPMLTKGMKNLGNQINAWAPERDGTSDGAIGNYAHTQEISDHDPDDTSAHNAGWDGDADHTKDVRAIDVDIDFKLPDVSAQILVDHIRKLPNLKSVLRYIIYNRKMYHERDNFAPTPYTGASAHTEHVHFSGAYTEDADQNSKYDFQLEEIPVALTDADKAWVKAQISEIPQLLLNTQVTDSRNPTGPRRALISALVYSATEAADRVIKALSPTAK